MLKKYVHNYTYDLIWKILLIMDTYKYVHILKCQRYHIFLENFSPKSSVIKGNKWPFPEWLFHFTKCLGQDNFSKIWIKEDFLALICLTRNKTDLFFYGKIASIMKDFHSCAERRTNYFCSCFYRTDRWHTLTSNVARVDSRGREHPWNLM